LTILDTFHDLKRYKFQKALKNLGNKAEVSVPPELLPMAAKMGLRGLLTQQAFQLMLRDFVLPFWAERQFRASDSGFIPRMAWLAVNLSYRRWTALGGAGHPDEAVVDPAGLLSPLRDMWSVDVWCEIGSEMVVPSKRGGIIQRYVRPNVLITQVGTKSWLLSIEHFCDCALKVPCVFGRGEIRNLSDETLKGRLIVAIRPYNPEGAAPIFELSFDEAKNTLFADGVPACTLLFKPDKIVLRTLTDGDVSNRLDEPTPSSIESADGFCFGCVQKSFELAPMKSASVEFVSPMDTSVQAKKRKGAAFIKQSTKLSYSDRRQAASDQAKDALEKGAKFTFPNHRLQESFDAARLHLYSVDDGETITPGPLTYHQGWFRDAAYMLSALDVLGWHAQAQQKIERFPRLQKRSGFFRSQKGEWDSNGQAIWTIAKHYKLARDKELLSRLWPSVWKGALWIEKKRSRTKKAEGPHRGLLPPGLSAEHFGPPDYYYWDDFWCAAGLREAAYLAKELGLGDEAARLEGLFAEFWGDIMKSIEKAGGRLETPVIPAGPYRVFDAAAIGSVCALYPLFLLNPIDARMTNTLDELEARCFRDGMFFQDFVHSGMNAYLTCHVAECRLIRRESKAHEIMRQILDAASPTYAWPEAVHPRTGYGCMGDGHHIWAAADWIHLLRNMILFEYGQELIITAAAPARWFEEGKRIEARGAPTEFGEVLLSIESTNDAVELNISGDYAKRPNRIIWHLPFTFKHVTIDGKASERRASEVVFEAGTSTVVVERR